jgi:hypothetical protein
VELTKDKAGLALARQRQADAALPDAVQVVKPRSVKNPFA